MLSFIKFACIKLIYERLRGQAAWTLLGFLARLVCGELQSGSSGQTAFSLQGSVCGNVYGIIISDISGQLEKLKKQVWKRSFVNIFFGLTQKTGNYPSSEKRMVWVHETYFYTSLLLCGVFSLYPDR